MKCVMIWFLVLSSVLVAHLASAADPYADEWDDTTYTKKENNAFANKSDKGNYDQFSLLAGASLSSLSGTEESPSARQGISLGAFLDLGATDFVFEMGLMYIEMGTTEQNLLFPNGSKARSELNLDYLSFPFLAKYYLSGRRNSTLYFKGGALLSFLLSDQARQVSTTTYYDLKVNESDYGPYVAVGGKININNQMSIRVEGSYYRGLTSVVDHFKAYNQTFQMTAGIGF